ncbi:MAG: hypothetical protein KDB82_09320, partial [Planctomycetes bacterium]|nr:hypothetical protein [Planctomycetota bacterium]
MRTPVILVALLLLALSAGVAFARGGDGGDYSGDGSSSGSSGSCYGSSSSSSDWGSSSSGTTSDTSDYDSSSGGDGGDGDIVGLVVILAIFGLAFGATVYDKLASRRRRKTGGARKNRKRKSRPDLSPLRRHDPNFSPVLFTAFAHLVYVKYHESRGGLARHNEEEFAVAPYISRKLRQQVHESNEDITQVIVGDMYIDALNLDNKNAQLCVNFKSNVVCKKRNGRLKRMLMQEQFLFKRALDSYTREPERVLALGCPSCGSKQEPDIDGRCPNCGEISGDGRMDWQVTAIHELEKP